MQGRVDTVQIALAYFDSEASRDIFPRLLLEWSERFARGQQKYQDVEHLGAKGVFPDVNRKTGRLRSDIWHERTPPPDAEPTREVILDAIGHLFLMLHLWDQEPLHGAEERLNAMGLESIPIDDPDAEPGGRREPNPCPNPHAHGDGWEDLPHAAREVLRRIAAGDRVGNVEREQVKMLVEKHDAD